MPAKIRVVRFSEIAACPTNRLDAAHYIPTHKPHPEKQLTAIVSFIHPVRQPNGTTAWLPFQEKIQGTLTEINFWVAQLKKHGSMKDIKVKFKGNK